LQNIQYYIDQFKSLLKPCNIYSQNKTWYRPRFQYRISFNFSDKNFRTSRYAADWNNFLWYCSDNDWKYRHRTETYNVLFTSETALLDAVLVNPDYRIKVTEFMYADVNYINEFSNHKGIDAITDIKFVKHAPEHCYQITLSNFEWRKDDITKSIIAEYLFTNRSNFVFKGIARNLIEDKARGGRLTARGISIFNGFKFYSKSTDDIVMIHIMAPGKVTNIVKMMERKS
jgi:hypothetical protein